METRDRIRKILYEQDVNLSQLAVRTGISVTTISFYLHNKIEISHKMAKRINKMYPQYSVSWLLGEEG